ncbi:MAG: hypothetical protein P8L20_01920, partial [Flavobacteriales bacterium]|nr:hypothetical protein [Flavobacteriales bacterium]
LLLLGTSLGSMAQEKEIQKENRKTQKIAFISTKLELTTEEAEKFWPVYNASEAEFKQLKKAHKAAMGEKKKISEMSDTEVEKLLDKGLEIQQKELEIRKKYLVKFKEVLPIKKVAKLTRIEHEFRKRNSPKKGDKRERSMPPPPAEK